MAHSARANTIAARDRQSSTRVRNRVRAMCLPKQGRDWGGSADCKPPDKVRGLESFDDRPALPQSGSPATPLSRVHEIGGFASPSHDGFALSQSGLICGAFHGVADLTESLFRQGTVERVTVRNAKCLNATTCANGNT